MLNKAKHQLIMKQILKSIYSDVLLAPLFGFKGGTAASLFYGLDRFSVDLDFDLLADTADDELWQTVLDKVSAHLREFGTVKRADIKRYTIFLLLSYGNADHNIKVEISKRKPCWLTKECFELKDHLGIPMYVAKSNYLFASKLVALTTRKEFANRDLFDVHYYCALRWDIDDNLIFRMTGKNVKEYLSECIKMVESIKPRWILAGLGELLKDEKQKAWVKAHLKDETLFLLKSYTSVLS